MSKSTNRNLDRVYRDSSEYKSSSTSSIPHSSSHEYSSSTSSSSSARFHKREQNNFLNRSDNNYNYRSYRHINKENKSYYNDRYRDTSENRTNKYRDSEAKHEENTKHHTKSTRDPCSPMKRNNNGETMVDESPKKRFKIPEFNREGSQSNNASLVRDRYKNYDDFNSPKKIRSLSLSDNLQKKSYASTPKSERKTRETRVKELMEQSSAAIERNLSSSWGDILEELEEQTKEVNEYIEKVSVKYNLDKEKLKKNMEMDAEVLRKRQKRINFGKVTPEYQRYLLAVAKKDREQYFPKTPNKFRKCSRRKFDGQIKKWRKLLHVWDENPDQLVDYKNSIDEENENDITDEFGGGASNITASNNSINLDDFEIGDEEFINIEEAN